MTYTLIAHQELTSSQASIVFNSIPQTFDDLLLVFSLRLASSGNIGGFIKLNGTQNTQRILFGTGSGVTSDTGNLTATANASSWTANTFSNGQIYIPNYKSTNAKSFSFDAVTENNGTQAFAAIAAGLVSNSVATTSLEIYSADSGSGGNFVQFSSATLYGITAGSSGGVVIS